MAIVLNRILERLRGQSAKLIFVAEATVESVQTFDDLYRDTRQLVANLRQMGVKPGHRIGIFAPNSYAWMMWDLAAIELRCVSVAFAQDKVGDSLQHLVDRYALHLIAVDPNWVSGDALLQPHVVAVDAAVLPGDKRALERAPGEHAPGTHSLVFSSGTTGKTKGLIISAPGTERLVNLYGDAFGVREAERFLTFLPFANYQQRMAYYFCLHHGIDLVYAPFPLLFHALKKHQPTYFIAPPILYESVQNLALATARKGNTAERLVEILGGNIRYLVTGMAPIKKSTLEFFWNQGLPLYEAFGITEAGMVTWNKPGNVKLGTVGKPAEPGSVRLTAEGEVVVMRDALLSLGYFEASDEDRRATFIAANAVATGDIAQFDAEGFLTIVGRKKDAIITKSGEKFHPEPIESLIQHDSRVKVAVVTECESLPGTTAIICIQNSGDPEAKSQIRQQIEQINSRLPVYQQVKKVIFTQEDFSIENGLRTKNLKLNRKAIRAAFPG